ncbi:MAG: selenide, water dikinase SelD [Lachnospirales bacterium]
MNENNDLNKYCDNGGCMAKLGPKFLQKVLTNLPKTSSDNLLVGYESSDDASVYKISDNVAIVQTMDFFTPLVEDPYIFGQIAATNALSDVYAMGGDVTSALNIVCFPEKENPNILGEILRGGAEKVAEAGGVLTGGHSINDADIKYGLSVNGIVDPNKIYKNNNTKVGDKLIMTKLLGSSIILTAKKVDVYDEEAYNLAILQMTTLNKYTKEVLESYDVHAVTDITGFGFLGHMLEMINGNSFVVNSKDVIYIEKAYEYAKEYIYTGGGQRNRKFVEDKVKFEINDFALEEVLFDPQTSGGFILSVSSNDAESLLNDLKDKNIEASIFGEVVRENKEYHILVK